MNPLVDSGLMQPGGIDFMSQDATQWRSYTQMSKRNG